ncbi:AFG1 family ATPase [Pseudomonas sp. KSR10]|uniref:cell division protein ZapE n=1 Tax=Pseudomonas sp. KSR10 TaxID=2916654 RepID=UPI001EF954AB|nr:cell division protein ZapE [Pseudomonas sp. KSR10]MCG6539070.1 AFG1 family ATPase [Pseudomonas sp. KSR10]
MTSDSLPVLGEPPAQPVAAQVRQGFQASLATRGYRPDAAQQAAIERLARWLDAWLGGRGWLRAPKAGVYLWGGVGRGKSFVMDAFFAAAPLEAKRRVHFHAFLHEVQLRLKQISGQRDPLEIVAREIAERTRLLCFDEFHVHDIGDAMLLGRLLKHLVEQGVGLVATSNYPPGGLCPNPLYRDRFKPAIELIERRFDVYNLEGGEDYRLRVESDYVWGEYAPMPHGDLAEWIATQLPLSVAAEREVIVEVNHRPLRLRAREGAQAWLDFDELCRLPRSCADFLRLTRQFERLALTGVTALDGEGIDVQQRFLNLIDILYDSGVALLLVAEASPEHLLSVGGHVDFARTRSRLRQLRSLEGVLFDRMSD